METDLAELFDELKKLIKTSEQLSADIAAFAQKAQTFEKKWNKHPKEPPLRLGDWVGQGEDQTKQLIYLVRKVGLAKAHKICRENAIYGIKKEGLLFVDVTAGKKDDRVRAAMEKGKAYYIYINLSREAKQAFLDKLAQYL